MTSWEQINNFLLYFHYAPHNMLVNLVILIDSCGGVQEGNVKAMNENVYVIKLL